MKCAGRKIFQVNWEKSEEVQMVCSRPPSLKVILDNEPVFLSLAQRRETLSLLGKCDGCVCTYVHLYSFVGERHGREETLFLCKQSLDVTVEASASPLSKEASVLLGMLHPGFASHLPLPWFLIDGHLLAEGILSIMISKLELPESF